MILTYDHNGESIMFSVPPTTADVLDWVVWIRCMDPGPQQMAAAFQWADKWVVDRTSDDLRDLFTTVEGLAAFCVAIEQAAGLPPDVLASLAAHIDRENEIPEDWKPERHCGCARCRRGIESNQPCELDDVDPRALRAAGIVSGVDGSARYYVSQVRSVIEAGENRRLRYEREDREAKAKSAEMLDKWRGRH